MLRRDWQSPAPDTQTMTLRRSGMVVLVLVLALAASLPLFVAIQNSTLYVATVRGHFYSALPGTGSFLDRATDRTSLQLLRFSLEPFLMFLILQCGSAYAASTLFRTKEFSVRRRLSFGFLVSFGITAVCLVGFWAELGIPRGTMIVPRWG